MGRRARVREQNREAILQAARDLLSESGAEGLSLREVARRADHSPAGLYEYFKSREDILLALYREGFQMFGAALRAVPRDQPTRERLRGLGQAYVGFARAHPQHYHLMFTQSFAHLEPTPEVFAEANSTFETLVKAVADGVARGELPAMDTAGVMSTSVTLWSVLHGLVMLHQAGRLGGPEALGELLDPMLDRLFDGLKPNDG